MKLSSGFLSHTDGGETLLIPTGAAKFSGLVRSNTTAGVILGCLEQETTEDEIVGAICSQFDVDAETARRDVRHILTQLRGIGAIDE
ncbi:MAG: PqqD family protein [Oscillospiraceae bacterium]|nr:PqqD family protein [Oscillospiraceae bacterium]